MLSKSSRKLVAIMFTDIVGYTALMQKDEGEAVLLRDRHRESFKRLHEKYNGEILQYYGDGTLSIFESSVEAVQCANELQLELLIEPMVPLRIGIHIGDIIKTKEEIIGDGVNLASRIENLAVAGSVLISEEVQQHIKNHEIPTKSMGYFKLKNVIQPTEVFALNMVGLTIPTTGQMEIKGHLIKPKHSSFSYYIKLLFGILIGISILTYIIVIDPFSGIIKSSGADSLSEIDDVTNDISIAVLPFINLSNEVDQEYFSDGIMDEILNHLYKIGGLRIPSRTSSMRYKGVSDKSIRDIGNELGVSHILEGSVRKFGSKVRIIVNLINVNTDDHLWSEDYEEQFDDVFVIQSNIAKKVAKELKAKISPEVIKRIETIPTENTEAYNLFLEARYYLIQGDDPEKARQLLDEAITLDNNFAEAYAFLGSYWLVRGSWVGDLEAEELINKTIPLLNKAKELNKDYPYTYVFLAQIHQWFSWDFDAAGKAWETFFQLWPSNTVVHSSYYDYLNSSGRFQESVDIVEKAISNDPTYSSWGSGLSYFFNNQPEKAIYHYETALRLFPNSGKINGLGRVYIYTEKYPEAINLLEEYVNKGNDFPRPLGNLAIAYFHTGQKNETDGILKTLKQKSQLSSVGSPSFYIAMIYAQMNELELAFEWLEKAYIDHEVEMYWLKVEPPFKPLHEDARWQKILDKVGFPNYTY